MNHKNELQLSDLTYQLSQIDYGTLFDIIKPLIICYIGKISLNNYQLHRDFTPKKFSSIKVPPKIAQKHFEIDEGKLLKQAFGDSVIDFAKTIAEKMPNADLTYFYNNINSLMVNSKSLTLHNLIFRTNTVGTYNTKKNRITLVESNWALTLPHELFHMASSTYLKNGNQCFCGFKVTFAKTLETIGIGLTEGYTQLLTERYFGDENRFSSGYPVEVQLVKNLELIIGREKMESFYLKADLYHLVQELKQFADDKMIMNFIAHMDFLTGHLNNRKLIALERKMITSSLTNATQFLLRCYIKKVAGEHKNGLIDEELLYELLTDYISNLSFAIDIGRGRKTKILSTLTAECLLKILTETFAIFDLEFTGSVTGEDPQAKKR